MSLTLSDVSDVVFQELFGPIVKHLGYEYSESESVDTKELRTRAITQAALAGDQEWVPYTRITESVLTQWHV